MNKLRILALLAALGLAFGAYAESPRDAVDDSVTNRPASQPDADQASSGDVRSDHDGSGSRVGVDTPQEPSECDPVDEVHDGDVCVPAHADGGSDGGDGGGDAGGDSGGDAGDSGGDSDGGDSDGGDSDGGDSDGGDNGGEGEGEGEGAY